jgi:hypothetical protein
MSNNKKPVEATKTDVTVASTNALQAYDFGGDAEKGLENITNDEFRIPFIRILQANSPQCAPSQNGGIKGAIAGAFFNTATGEVYPPEGFDFIPVHRDHNYTEWFPRAEDGSGGGFVGIRAADDDLALQLKGEQGKFGKLKVDGGTTELVETFYLFGFALVDDQPIACVIGFSSSQIKKYQSFIGRVMNMKYRDSRSNTMVLPPMWFHKWHLESVYETKKAFAWYGYKITLSAKNEDGTEAPAIKSTIPMSDPLYAAGRKFYEDLVGGVAKADVEKSGLEEATDESPL